jgi:hypothetical protein
MGMYYFLLIGLLFSNLGYSLDVGNGSLGACTEASFTNNNSGPYNCASLTVGAAFNFIGDTGITAPVVIKVTGDVIINNTLSVNGASGAIGKNDDGSGTNQGFGGIPGRGGFAGGDTGIDATTVGGNGVSGGYTGAGFGGTNGTESGIGVASGGGGGGACFGGSAFAGVDGINLGAVSAGAGGAAGTSNYAPENNFKSLLVGGSGGGSGGPSADSGDNYDMGGSGGGGGGAIHIMAGGDITINGIIRANGGNGGAGFEYSGGGGGGSGGAIFLEALGDVFVNGSISANGGTGGAGAPSSANATDGNGGNGSIGRIRIDDQDGSWSGTGTVTPSAYQAVVDLDLLSVTQIDSGISCGSIQRVDEQKNFFNYFLGMVIGLLFAYNLRHVRFKILRKINIFF